MKGLASLLRSPSLAPIAPALAVLAVLAHGACNDSNGSTTDVATTAADTTTAADSTVASETVAETVAETGDEVAAETTPDETIAPSETTETETVTRPACDDHTVACQDEQIQTLELSDTASGGAITEEGTTAGEFLTHIDATAGGLNGTKGYTYARFTDGGLVAVALSDYDALESRNWDIAFRRFVIRLNSGVSGPSCVVGGRTAPDTDFDALTTVPPSVTFHEEQYFTADSCDFVPDTSGIGAAQTVLSSYWSYPGCVAMTGNVYLLWLPDGRAVKLQVISYYTPSVQKNCDDNGQLTTPSGGGNFRIRWAFVK